MEEDIYGDLDTLDNQFDLVQEENDQLKNTVQKLEETTIKFSIEINELKRINGNLELNISKLFKTAKAEIERKNKQIAELRKNLDNMLFKRGSKRKIPEKDGDEFKEKQILTEQFEKAQQDIDQKNRIIKTLNMELDNVRREVEEKNNALKRNSSQIDDLNENHVKAKKSRMDRGETYVDNEEEYRNYRHRYMRENGHYHSRSKSPYRTSNSRERGQRNNDLRSKIELKRIKYRRSRSRSREDYETTDRRCNKERYRNVQYRGKYTGKKPVEYDQHYGYNSVEDEKQHNVYEYGEQDSGVFNSQTTENSYENMGTEPISPEFKQVGGDLNTTNFVENLQFESTDTKYFDAIQKSKLNQCKKNSKNCVDEIETKSEKKGSTDECKEFIINDAWEIIKHDRKDEQLQNIKTEEKIELKSTKIKNIKPKPENSKIVSDCNSDTKDIQSTSSKRAESKTSKSKDEKSLTKNLKTVLQTKSKDLNSKSISAKIKQDNQISEPCSNISIVSDLQPIKIKREKKISESTNIKVDTHVQSTITTKTKFEKVNVAESTNSNISLVSLKDNVKKTESYISTIKQDVLALKQGLPVMKKNISVKKQDVPAKIQDILVKKQDIPAMKQDVSAKKQDVSANTQNVSEMIQDVSAMKQDIPAMKQDVTAMKQDVTVTKQNVPAMKQDVTAMKQDVTAIKQDVTVTKQNVPAMKQDVTAMKQDVTAIKQDVTVTKQNVPAMKQDVTAMKQVVPAVKQDITDVSRLLQYVPKTKDDIKIVENNCERNITESDTMPISVSILDNIPTNNLPETTDNNANNSPPIINVENTTNAENTTNVQNTNDRKPPLRGRRRRCVISII